MHRPQSIAESTTSARLWLRHCGWPSLIVAAAWAITGRISFLLEVDHVLVTPAFFFPEAFALAFALRFGPGIWPGIFVGHQLLILGRDLPVMAGLGVSAANSLEAILAVWLFRRLGGKTDIYDVRSWALLQAMIFLVLQPFCAALGTGSLFAAGVIGDQEAWKAAALNWWSGSGMAQSQIAPLLLVLLTSRAPVSWLRQIVLPALMTGSVLAVAFFALEKSGIGTSLVLFQPLLVAFALLLGLPAVCAASAVISVAFLYATSHSWGPFYMGEATSLVDLNVFLIGISLIGQFLAVLFRQAAKQRETEKNLRDTREQLQRTAYELTENIPVSTYVLEFDAAGSPHFTFLSERFLAMTGLKREEVMANHALALQPMRSTDRSEIERLNREVFASKENFFWEGEITVRGEKRQVTLESIPRTRPGGGTIWEGVMTDITERKLAEQELAAANRGMRLAATAARLGFWEYDVETGLDQWDEEMARINGANVETFDGHWEKFVHPDDYDEVMRETRRMLESDRIFQMEYRIVRPDGEVRCIREHGFVTRGADGSALRAHGVMQDITEEKKASDNLLQATQSMRLAAAAAGIGFWSREIATNTEQWDEQMFRIYGVDRESFDGRWEKHVHPEDVERVTRETEAAIRSAGNSVYEFRVVRADGTIRHIKGLSTVVRDSEGRPMREIGVDFDITEEKETAERERQTEEKHRRDLETKLKTSLAAAAVAHEINQPLSAILLRTKMALEEKRGGLDALSEVANEAQRVVTTIEKMKTLMRNVQTEHRKFDLSGVVRSALLYNKTMLSRHAVAVRESGLDKPHLIMGDDAQVQLAITNILRNAAEAIDESAADRREISIELTDSDNEVVLTIGDSGPGWSGAQLAETPLATTKKGGTGIGLYVARTAMENHRGEIVFGSSPLGGAEVRLKFPRITEKA